MSAPLRGVLFDLDGTLLELDLRAFLSRYFAELETALAGFAGHAGSADAMRAVMEATDAMMRPHEGRTNRETFDECFDKLTGLRIADAQSALDGFYEDVFPRLKDGARPTPGAREAIESALGLGLGVAVATNPIFPRRAIEHRIAWAGLGDLPLGVITSYETMCATKPHPAYYRQTADMLGLAPGSCLMVGDDPGLDMPAADVGMLTYYVGSGSGSGDFAGDLSELARLLPRLAAG